MVTLLAAYLYCRHREITDALAIERGVATEQIAAAEGLALHAAAFNGMPDPVLGSRADPSGY
jgi:hypothetical protein